MNQENIDVLAAVDYHLFKMQLIMNLIFTYLHDDENFTASMIFQQQACNYCIFIPNTKPTTENNFLDVTLSDLGPYVKQPQQTLN